MSKTNTAVRTPLMGTRHRRFCILFERLDYVSSRIYNICPVAISLVHMHTHRNMHNTISSTENSLNKSVITRRFKDKLSNILYFLAVNKSNEKYLYCSTVELHCCWKTIKNALVSYTAAMSGMFLLFCFDLISHACCIKYTLELQTCIKILPNDMLFPFENYSTERFFAFLATVAVRLCGFSCLSVG